MSGGPFDIFGLGADPDRPEESPARKAQLNSKRPLPKRFYEDVSIVEDEGYQLSLDGRPVRTPARNPITLPSSALAEVLAEEWRAQKEFIDPKAMPLTRLVNSAVDGVATQIEAVQAEVAAFAGTDLLYYRAENPDRLVRTQNEHWDPVLDWASKTYQCRFSLAGGVMFVSQPAETIAALNEAVGKFHDPLRLAALHSTTTLMGSCLLALAVEGGFLTPEAAWQAAHVDEDWNIEQWGEDEEAQTRRAYRHADFQAASLLLGPTKGA